MNDALSEAIREAYASAPAGKVILDTLEIRQPGNIGSIYMVRAMREWIAKDETGVTRTFEPVGFQLSLPPSSEEGFKTLNVSIDNIDRRVSDFIEQALSVQTAVELVYRPYLSDDANAPHMVPPLVLYLKEVSITSYQVTGRATFMDLVNKKFPSEIYTRRVFPGLG